MHSLASTFHVDVTRATWPNRTPKDGVPPPFTPNELVGGMNFHLARAGLGRDVAVTSAEPVGPDFHARCSARTRSFFRPDLYPFPCPVPSP